MEHDLSTIERGGPSNPPLAEHVVCLKQILPILQEMLNYCIGEAMSNPDAGEASFSPFTDEMVYYLKVREFDRSLFETLTGVEEIWIVTNPRRES